MLLHNLIFYLQIIEEGAGSIWHENLGMIVLSFERRDQPPLKLRPPECQIQMLARPQNYSPNNSWETYYYMLGFDGYTYPMPNSKPYAASTSVCQKAAFLQELYDLPQSYRKKIAL